MSSWAQPNQFEVEKEKKKKKNKALLVWARQKKKTIASLFIPTFSILLRSRLIFVVFFGFLQKFPYRKHVSVEINKQRKRIFVNTNTNTP